MPLSSPPKLLVVVGGQEDDQRLDFPVLDGVVHDVLEGMGILRRAHGGGLIAPAAVAEIEDRVVGVETLTQAILPEKFSEFSFEEYAAVRAAMTVTAGAAQSIKNPGN